MRIAQELYEEGYITYSDNAKKRLLGVSEKTLKQRGAVSSPVVIGMAAGALDKSGAEIAISVSGIAGPEGGTLEKPTGTVWIAWQWENKVQTRRFLFAGNRSQVRLAAVEAALSGALEFIC